MDVKALLTRMFRLVDMVPEDQCTKKLDLGFMEVCSTPGRESLMPSAPTPAQELAAVVQPRDVSMAPHFGAFK